MIRWIKGIFKKHDLLITFILSTVFGLVLYAFSATREFGINFISEFSGVWITVFLINRIIEKRERKKRVSIDQRILKETLSVIASYFSIWKHLVWKYYPSIKIESEKDLIAVYSEILKATELTDQFEIVSIHDPESWKLFFHNRSIKKCFENYFETMQGDIRSLIDNFKLHLEPELLGHLLELSESQYLRDVNSIFQNDETDVLNEFGQDTNRLSAYISNETTHFNKIIELNRYCMELQIRISEFSDFNQQLYTLKNYFLNPIVAYSLGKK
jgi:hypothetical protein